jgi:hypothetical protein
MFLLVCAVSILPSCDETTSQGKKPAKSKAENVGFEAVITSTYEGKVSGNGVLVLLPDAGFEKQGYLFLSDGRGIRPHGVTFILPRGLAPGKHALGSPSPFDLGKMPSVRVDRDIGSATESSDRNTSGYLDLTSFPDDESKLPGSDVAGSFEFRTENPKGERISVTGKFSFKVK